MKGEKQRERGTMWFEGGVRAIKSRLGKGERAREEGECPGDK